MVLLSNIIIIAIAAIVAMILLSPDKTDPALKDKKLKVITHDDDVENFLSNYKDIIGDDYEGYRGHIYRVLTYALHFLDESPSYQSVIGIALVYHDIGLWTNGTLNYLEPSCKKAKYDMKKQKMSPTDVNLVQDIIYWHHKVTEYESDAATADTVSSPSLSYSKISAIKNDKIINAVRKADLIDFSFGIIKYGMPKEYIQFVQKKIPDAGFHKTLLLFAPKLYGYQVWRYPEIVGIFKF